MRAAPLIGLTSFAFALACGGPQTDAKYPAREAGCEVTLLKGDALPPSSENIGTASAVCSLETTSDADCLRELKDQACRLGGDIVWGVPEKPAVVDGKNRYTGRVAHTR